VFHGHRPRAVVAARKKFVLARLGDVLLLAAAIALYQAAGTGDLGAIFASAADQPASWGGGSLGLAAVLLARHLWLIDPAAAAAAAGAVIGHCFPIWLKFRGGKGVATTAGVCFGLAWPIGLAYAVVWLGTLALARISSLGGMLAVVAAPIAALATGHTAFAPVLAGIALLVLWLHRENIIRLRAGTEPRVGRKG